MEMTAEQEAEAEELIPYSSIPYEIATECLLRIPHRYHSTLKQVSHGWRSLLSRPSFYSQRLRSGSSDHLCFLLLLDSLRVFNLTRREWHRLSLSLAPKIPLFSQLLALPASGTLLLLGGWDPDTLEPVPHVLLIDLLSGTWRSGSPMPSPRSFFAAAVAGPGSVHVAGGHDANKNALRSALVYDVASDEWAALPSMAEERDECLGMAVRAGFLVVSGYGSASQGRFRQDAELFDPIEGRWSKVDGVWPSSTISPRSSCFGGGERGRWWWLAGDGEVNRFDWEEMRWKRGGKIPMPAGLWGGASSRVWAVDVGVDGGGGGEGRFMVIGVGEGGENRVFLVESEGKVWKRVDTPPNFSGLPFSTSHLLI